MQEQLVRVHSDKTKDGINTKISLQYMLPAMTPAQYSRFFDLDAWFRSKLPEQAQKTYPALIVPKPSKSEKNKYAENIHPTVKQLKLMSYLITMGSREGDLVLDPFAGSGTTLEAANMLKRRFIGCELDEKYKDLIESRAFMRTKTKNT